MLEDKLLVHDMTDLLNDVYLRTTGKRDNFVMPAPERPYSDEESEIIGEDYLEGVAILFSENGDFINIGLRGDWYKPMQMRKNKRLSKIFSTTTFDELGLVENLGQTQFGEYIAHVEMN